MQNEVSVAFLALLERLGPEKRAAFLLKEVFDYDYPEIAQMLGKAEPALRQMVHRAREEVRTGRPKFTVTEEARERLLEKFMAAATTGDRTAIMALLSEDAEYMSDGGGKVYAALKVLHGPERIGRLFYSIARSWPGIQYRFIRVNGEVGVVNLHQGRLHSVLSFRMDADRISGIYTMRNPDKLAGIRVDALHP
jgi:RNA polymerase sigma-70 factor (ECF subfamily)